MTRAIVSIIAMQIAATVAACALFWIFGDRESAKSALIGGVIAFMPSALYAWRVIRSHGGSPAMVLRAQYAGEFGKLLLTAALFAATFAWVRDISALPLFASYAATLAMYWAALVMFSKI